MTEPRPPLSEETKAAMRQMIERYPVARSALGPMLYLVQAEHGFVSDEGIAEAAAMLGLTKAEVAAVASFYTMYKRAPVGRYLVSVCSQPPCALAGAGAIIERLEEDLGISCGESLADGSISLEEVECLCACDGAPVLQVNYENYERLGVAEALDLVRTLRDGGPPPPGARGEPPHPSDVVHRRMANVEAPR